MWVRLPLWSLIDRVVQRQRRLGDNQEMDGSIPSAITFKEWSVGVLAAHVCGKDGDRVRRSDGPLDNLGLHADGGD